MNANKLLGFVALGLLVLVIAISSVYVVHEQDKAVVVRFGEIVRVDNAPGLHFKMPLVDQARSFSMRMLPFSAEAQPFRTADEKEIVVDVAGKWRIVDLQQYYISVGGQEASARKLLEQQINSRLTEELGRRALKVITGGEWNAIGEALTATIDKETRKSGIEIVDMRLQRIGMASTQAVYDRMRNERLRIAEERREQGEEAAAKIRADADRNHDAIKAEGYVRAERIRGEGDARAAAIYASAASIAPEFFTFYRSLSAYRETFKKGDVLVVDPSSEFFKYMKKPTR